MNALSASPAVPPSRLPATATDDELVHVLRGSLYPGASPASIQLVLGYCRQGGLDPMQKPVHIVPMKVSTGERDERGWEVKETRDVVMPGIGLYRIQAARTGQYMGVSEPEFGPMRTLTYSETVWEDGPSGRRTKRHHDATLEFPEWCRVTVLRLVAGQVCQFTAKEYWLENYATKSADSTEPNAMWKKRPMAQLGKCAEAQALRKAFPEVGSQPTADEMAGKHRMDDDYGTVDEVPAAPAAPAPVQTYPDAEFAANMPTWARVVESGKRAAEDIVALASSRYPLTDAQRVAILALQPAAAAPTPAPAPAPVPADAPQDAEIVWSYAQVATRLARAQTSAQLEEAADLIRMVQDAQHRAELQAIYHEARERMGDKQ